MYARPFHSTRSPFHAAVTNIPSNTQAASGLSTAYHTRARNATCITIQNSVLIVNAIAPHSPAAAGAIPVRASAIAIAGTISHSGASGATMRSNAFTAGPAEI